MNKNPLLSIAIPTFNRLDYLLENLKHLLPQIRKYKDDVELIISDNCSIDDPSKRLSTIADLYGVCVNFFRQRENIGADKNIEFVANQTQGDYLFVYGDDDILSPNFLDIIIPILKTHKYGAIHYGRLTGDADCSNNKVHNPIYNDSVQELSANDFVLRCLSTPNLLSSIIVDKKCWIQGSRMHNEEYYGYNWFAYYYFGLVELSKPCVVYYFPLLIMRNPSRGWSKYWPLYAVVGLSNIFKDLDEKVPGVYLKWLERLHDKRFYNLKNILCQVYGNKVFYREKRKEFYPHLTNNERKFFNYWLYTPIPRISNRIFSLIQRLNNI